MASSSYLIDTNTTNLITFFERNLSTLKLDAHSEITTARYAFMKKVQNNEVLMEALQTILASDTNLTPEAIFAIRKQITSLADEIIKASGYLTKTLKTAAEIEVLSNTHFDSIQLFYLISQLPNLITQHISDQIKSFVLSILDKVDSHGSTRTSRISLELELASFITALVSDLTNSLQHEIEVLDRSGSNTSSSVPLISEQLKNMESLTCPQITSGQN